MAEPNEEFHYKTSDFQVALVTYLSGDQTNLVAYLYGARRISHGEQVELAWAMEERARPKRGRPVGRKLFHLKGLAGQASSETAATRPTSRRLSES